MDLKEIFVRNFQSTYARPMSFFLSYFLFDKLFYISLVPTLVNLLLNTLVYIFIWTKFESVLLY